PQPSTPPATRHSRQQPTSASRLSPTTYSAKGSSPTSPQPHRDTRTAKPHTGPRRMLAGPNSPPHSPTPPPQRSAPHRSKTSSSFSTIASSPSALWSGAGSQLSIALSSWSGGGGATTLRCASTPSPPSPPCTGKTPHDHHPAIYGPCHEPAHAPQDRPATPHRRRRRRQPREGRHHRERPQRPPRPRKQGQRMTTYAVPGHL